MKINVWSIFALSLLAFSIGLGGLASYFHLHPVISAMAGMAFGYSWFKVYELYRKERKRD